MTGRKTSIYLTSDLDQLARANDRPLGEALYRGLAVEPLFVEESKEGGFITHWYCAVPPKGTKFQVFHDHWLDTTPPVREIYEIEITRERIRADLGDEQICEGCGTRLHRMQPDDWPFVDDKNRVHGILTDTGECVPGEPREPGSFFTPPPAGR